MTTKDPGYLYLESLQRYVSVGERSFFHFESYRHNVSHYKNLRGTPFIIKDKELGLYSTFKKWIEHSILSEEDKKSSLALLAPYKEEKIMCYTLNMAKTPFDIDVLGGVAQVESAVESNQNKVLNYLEALKDFEIILKNYKLRLNSPIFELREFQNYVYSRDLGRTASKEDEKRELADKKSKYVTVYQIPLNELLPSLDKNLLSSIEQVSKYAPEIPKLYKTKEEDKASTDKLYVVYCTGRNNEGGFVSKKHDQGPLSEAEIFYDERRAERSCKAKSISNYQVWEVSMHFNAPKLTHSNFTSSSTLDTIVAKQQKELIEKAMQTHVYLTQEAKLKKYEEILRSNNLLPSEDIKVEAEPRKKHKI